MFVGWTKSRTTMLDNRSALKPWRASLYMSGYCRRNASFSGVSPLSTSAMCDSSIVVKRVLCFTSIISGCFQGSSSSSVSLAVIGTATRAATGAATSFVTILGVFRWGVLGGAYQGVNTYPPGMMLFAPGAGLYAAGLYAGLCGLSPIAA